MSLGSVNPPRGGLKMKMKIEIEHHLKDSECAHSAGNLNYVGIGRLNAYRRACMTCS